MSGMQPNLSHFPKSRDNKRNNLLQISDEYARTFNLKNFLLENVLGSDFEEEHEGREIIIDSGEKLLQVIIHNLKAKEYIGVGVGGLYISTDIDDHLEYALLYKRYHPPEDQMWSMLGGSSKIHEKIEDTLQRKISRITNISKDAIVVKDIIRANNHDESDFHFMSPAFYVDIINIKAYLCWGNQKDKKGKKRQVTIIKDVKDFDKIGTSTYEKPHLAWVPVSMITGEFVDSDGEGLFSFTTLSAVERHLTIREATSQIVNAAELVKSYKDWRIRKI